MRRARTLIFLLLILIVGLAVAYFGIRALQQYLTPPPPAPVYVQIFMAGQNIPQGAKVTEDALTTINVPAEQVSAVEFTVEEKGQLVNQVAKFPIDQGVVITKSMVAPSAEAVSIAGPQWAALIPPGMTATSIPATRLSLAAFGISDGAHVNVNACFLFVDLDPAFQSITPDNVSAMKAPGTTEGNLPVLSLDVTGKANNPQGRIDPELSIPPNFYYLTPSEDQRPRLVCQTIVQDAVVLKSGDFPLPGAATAQAQQQTARQQQNAPPPTPDVVTIIVTPQDAITLAYMTSSNARISLALRNPGDQSRQSTEAATLQFLLSQYNIPVPAKLPYDQQPATRQLSPP
jgi:Flp pilus assembly protein CpaB